jgi:hypothetical protein
MWSSLRFDSCIEHEICFFNSTAQQKQQTKITAQSIHAGRRRTSEKKKEIFFREGKDNGGLQGKRSSMGSMRRSSPAGAGPGEAIAGGWGTQREISGRWVRRREEVEGREKKKKRGNKEEKY